MLELTLQKLSVFTYLTSDIMHHPNIMLFVTAPNCRKICVCFISLKSRSAALQNGVNNVKISEFSKTSGFKFKKELNACERSVTVHCLLMSF